MNLSPTQWTKMEIELSSQYTLDKIDPTIGADFAAMAAKRVKKRLISLQKVNAVMRIGSVESVWGKTLLESLVLNTLVFFYGIQENLKRLPLVFFRSVWREYYVRIHETNHKSHNAFFIWPARDERQVLRGQGRQRPGRKFDNLSAKRQRLRVVQDSGPEFPRFQGR